MVEGHLRSVTTVFVELNKSHFKRIKDYGTGLFHSTAERLRGLYVTSFSSISFYSNSEIDLKNIKALTLISTFTGCSTRLVMVSILD